MYLVLEDDVILAPAFAARWAALRDRLEADDRWDIVWLGVLDDRDLYGDVAVDAPGGGAWPGGGPSGLVRLRTAARSFGGGLFAYALRSRAARALLALAREVGVQQAVDWWVLEQALAHGLTCYKAHPPLASTPEGAGRDSDNAEKYPQVRLLLDAAGDDGDAAGARGPRRPPPPLLEFALLSPAPGATLAARDFAVLVDIAVAEPANLFQERHKDSRVCFELRRTLGGWSAAPPPGAAGGDGAPPAAARTELAWRECRVVGEAAEVRGLADGRYAMFAALSDMFGETLAAAVSEFVVDAPADAAEAGAEAEARGASALEADAKNAEADAFDAELLAAEVVVDGAPTRVACARGELYACTRRFCAGLSEPRRCMSGLVGEMEARWVESNAAAAGGAATAGSGGGGVGG